MGCRTDEQLTDRAQEECFVRAGCRRIGPARDERISSLDSVPHAALVVDSRVAIEVCDRS